MIEAQAGRPPVSQQLSTDRRRAKYAYERVIAAKDTLSSEKAERYGALAEKLPALLQTNGLGATLAFLAAKGMAASNKKDVRLDSKEPEGKLLLDLAEWLGGERGFGSKPVHTWLMERLTLEGGPAYRRDTAEVLALSAWLKRLCAALIQKKGAVDHA